MTGRQESRRRLLALRPEGTADWLLLYTEAGQAYVRFTGGEFVARAGDIILFAPGTAHDYGLDERLGYWKNIWVHFLPRPDCLGWLQWPRLAPGIMRLHLDEVQRESVSGQLLMADEHARAAQRRHEELAVNALERALLLCDGLNPRHSENQLDPRIRKAIDMICGAPEQACTLESLAKRCGLSRSRLADLFRRQTGMTPMAFLEDRRLRRTRELLLHTTLNLTEISEQCGFSSPFYLSLRFKKRFGLSPDRYRRKGGRLLQN